MNRGVAALLAMAGLAGGCAHAGLAVTPALKGQLLLGGTGLAPVFADLARALGRHGWLVVYQDGAHLWADRPATEAERARLGVPAGERLLRRLESDLAQLGPDVSISYHTVHVAVRADGSTRVLDRWPGDPDPLARENAAVFRDLRGRPPAAAQVNPGPGAGRMAP